MDKLDFTDHGVFISHEDALNPQKFRRAQEMAAEKFQTLYIADPVPQPWQPPEDAIVLPHDATLEEHRAAKSEAEATGLAGGVVFAPEHWTGDTVRTRTEEWTPPPNSIVVPFPPSWEDWQRAQEAARRLRCKVVLAPAGVRMPEKLPEQIQPGLPVVIPRNAPPAEYRRLKKLAEDRRVPYSIAAE